jgi:HAMP domain-containing protein
MAAEISAGILLLVGGRAARIGWVAVISFHVLLLLFGWWIWAWCLPALALLVRLAQHDLNPGREPS